MCDAFGCHIAGNDAVDIDSPAADLSRQVFGESEYGALGCGVDGISVAACPDGCF